MPPWLVGALAGGRNWKGKSSRGAEKGTWFVDKIRERERNKKQKKPRLEINIFSNRKKAKRRNRDMPYTVALRRYDSRRRQRECECVVANAKLSYVDMEIGGGE